MCTQKIIQISEKTLSTTNRFRNKSYELKAKQGRCQGELSSPNDSNRILSKKEGDKILTATPDKNRARYVTHAYPTSSRTESKTIPLYSLSVRINKTNSVIVNIFPVFIINSMAAVSPQRTVLLQRRMIDIFFVLSHHKHVNRQKE